MKNPRESVKHETHMKSFKKCSISNAFDATEDDALFEGSESPDSNMSYKCDSRDKDLLEFYDQ
jgi:hypothetical protein